MAFAVEEFDRRLIQQKTREVPVLKRKTVFNGLGWLLALAGFAIVIRKEMTKAADERTWCGELLGFVPYDLRVPTPQRIVKCWWNPDWDRILTPTVWGIGWSLNLGRLARTAGLV